MKLNYVLITIFSIIEASHGSSNTGDACSKLSALLHRDSAVTTTNVLDCYKKFPFSDSIRFKTLKAFRNVLELYAFRDAINDSPDPEFQPNVDIVKSLRNIQSKNYKTDFEFQIDLMRSLYPLNDGHTVYISECYNQFSFLQPLFLVPVSSPKNKLPSVYIHSVDMSIVGNVAANLTEFLGARVLQIDGQPSSQYLQQFANKFIGFSKEMETRYQLNFARLVFDNEKRTFVMRRGFFAARSYDPPVADSVKYKVLKRGEIKPVEVEIPWFVKPNEVNATWGDAESFWSEFCALKEQSGLSSTYKPRRPPQIPIKLRVPYDSVVVQELQSVPRKANFKSHQINEDEEVYLQLSEKVADPTPILHGDGYAFFLFTPKNSASPVGVYKMSEFAWADEEWREGMIKGFTALRKAGAQRVLIDLFNNGGGYICTSHTLVSLLTSGKARPFPTDFRVTKGMEELITGMWNKGATNSSFFPGGSVDEGTGKPYEDLSMVLNATQRITPSGRKVYGVRTSKRFYESCDDVWGDYKLPFAPKNLVIISNGYCGSSCALTAAQINEYQPETQFVAFNALGDKYARKWNNEWSLTSFPGSEVYNTGYLSQDVSYIGSKNPSLDVVFPTKASMSFTVREAWSRKNNKILEFMRWGTKNSVKWTAKNVLRYTRIWEEAYQKVFE